MAEQEMYRQLDALPNCLRYGAKQLQIRVNRATNLVPIGTDSVTSSGSGTVRFRFPSASIIDLSTISISFTSTISNLVVGAAGSNFVNALIPAAYKYVRRAQFYLGGVAVAGALSNQYNQVYHAFVKASTNKQYCHGKALESYPEVSDIYDQYGPLVQAPTGTSKSAFQVISDFLTLPKGNGGCSNMMIDTSLWNDLELQLDFDNNSILSIWQDGTATGGANVAWALANIRLNVDVISSIPGIYANFLELRSSEGNAPIRLAFQNFVSQIALIQPTTRLQVSSTCIDGLMIACLPSNYNSTVPFIGNVLVSATTDVSNPPKFNFKSPLDDAAARTAFQASIQVGTALYPQTPYNCAYLLADSTLNHFWHASMMATSLLYSKENAITGSVATSTIVAANYVLPNFLSNNFIWVQSFSLSDGWADHNKVLSGVDTSQTNLDMLIISSGLYDNSTNYLMVGLLTSVLEFDTVVKTVRVIQ
jgi:hypothetical protein